MPLMWCLKRGILRFLFDVLKRKMSLIKHIEAIVVSTILYEHVVRFDSCQYLS